MGLGSQYDSVVPAGAIACASRAKNRPLQRIELKYTNANHMANLFVFGLLQFAFLLLLFSLTKLLQLGVHVMVITIVLVI